MFSAEEDLQRMLRVQCGHAERARSGDPLSLPLNHLPTLGYMRSGLGEKVFGFHWAPPNPSQWQFPRFDLLYIAVVEGGFYREVIP